MADGTVIPYFDKEDADFKALQKIVLDQRWMKSLKFYVHSQYDNHLNLDLFLHIVLHIFKPHMHRHTGCLESFHNVILKYATKRISYRYKV